MLETIPPQILLFSLKALFKIDAVSTGMMPVLDAVITNNI